jgi:hypothetical protein
MAPLQNNRRRKQRVPFACPVAVFVDGKLIGECTIQDISESGIRFTVPEETDLPVEFTLVLSRNGRVRRECQKIWRNGRDVGAVFVS